MEKKRGRIKWTQSIVSLLILFFSPLCTPAETCCVWSGSFWGPFTAALMYSENMKARLMFANVTAVLRTAWPRVSGCSFFFLSRFFFFVSFSMHE